MKTRSESSSASSCPTDHPSPAAAAVSDGPLRVEVIRDGGRPVDICVQMSGRSLTMLGSGGPRRELDASPKGMGPEELER